MHSDTDNEIDFDRCDKEVFYETMSKLKAKVANLEAQRAEEIKERTRIRGVQTGISRAMLGLDIDLVEGQFNHVVEYVNVAIKKIDKAMEVPEGSILLVRGNVLGDPVYLIGAGITKIEYGSPTHHIEITLKHRSGRWEFWNLEIFGRFGPCPWAYVTSDDREIWRHDGELIKPVPWTYAYPKKAAPVPETPYQNTIRKSVVERFFDRLFSYGS